MPKWIDLKDASGARLKLADLNIQGQPTLHLFVTNLAYLNPKWRQCVQKLGFREAPSRKYLVRRVESGEKLAPSAFRSVFPQAALAEMAAGDYMLQFANRPQQRAQPGQAPDGVAAVDLRGVNRLGRNVNGQEVYDSLSGRFILGGRSAAERVLETHESTPGDYLRLAPLGQTLPQGRELERALLLAARGFVKSMDMGEVQHSEDYAAFRGALFPQDQRAELTDLQIDDLISQAIDGALLRTVRSQHDVAGEAYMPMARLYDYLPPHKGTPRGLGVVPQPLNIAAQRLLGDTTDKVVLVPNAFDGASFAFLPEGTRIRAFKGLQAEQRDLSGFAVDHPGATWLGRYVPMAEQDADAMLFNADPARDERGGRRDYTEALMSLRSLAPGARAVMVLAADGAAGRVDGESAAFLRALAARCSVEDVFETAPILSQKAGGSRGLRVYSLRNVSGDAQRVESLIEQGVDVKSSWEEIKTHIDETLNLLQVREAESEKVDVERAAEQQSYQRPYIAFSKVGEARTMVPANLQASAQAYLTRVEQLYGPMDDFVSRQLGMGFATLAANFSPEQVDGIAVMISRQLIGRSSILADDTGIGKGRQLAAMATWANKGGVDVVFVTDRANLFSDLARDLKHIGEWERFRPLVLNADGEITHEEYPGAEPTVLAKGTPPAVMTDIIERGATLKDVQANIVFLTYSQIATAESAKALWIKNQLANALVIFDEAHIAAGSDSNVAVQVSEMAGLAKYCQFASATWAKSHLNMHIYQRAFPTSVSVATLSETMRKGGESFSEIFSGMLSHDGALIRREHDLSKLEVEMLIDEARRQRNEQVSDLVADVLGAASFINGDMQQVFIRTNADSVRKLKDARDVRLERTRGRAKLFSSAFGAGSVIYEVMKGVQGALNAEFVGDLAVQTVREGMKPVIVSDATGERLLEEIIETQEKSMREPGEDGGVTHVRMPTLRDLLSRVVLRHLSSVRVAEVTLEDIDEAELSDLQPQETLASDDEGADAQAIAAAAQAAAVAVEGLQEQGEAPAQRPAEAAVDVAAAFERARREQDGLDRAADDDEEDAGPRKSRPKRRIIYRDVPISELVDMPQEAKERYAEGIKELQAKILAVPDIPVLCFDAIAQRLRAEGFSVGEISGRKKRLEWDEQAGLWSIVKRATSKKAVKSTIRAFNNGGIQAVVINRSAATGVSMHSSPRFLDQSRRRLIEHQIPENPVDRIQLLGRVNRFDQLSSPLITTASTGIYGEVRYLMMQNKKLARMSANVRSSRDNAMSLKSVRDLFNVVGKEAVQDYLADNPLVAKRLGLSQFDIENSPDIVNKVTMRIPLLKVSQQEAVYNDLYSRMDEILFRAELEGHNPLKPGEMDLRAKVESESIFFGEDLGEDAMMSAFDAPVIVRKISWSRELNPMTFAAVKAVCDVNVDRLVDAGLVVPDGPSAGAASLNNDAGLVFSQTPASRERGEEVTPVDVTHVPGVVGEQAVAERQGPDNDPALEPVGAFRGPKLSPDLVAKVVEGFKGLARLSHMSSEIESFDEAVLNHTQTRRAFVKWKWLERNLPLLAPGARVIDNRPSSQEGNLTDLFSRMSGSVIVDVRPPSQEDQWLDLGKWQLALVSPGEDRPKTFSLRSIVSKIEGSVTKGEITGELRYSFLGQYFTGGIYHPRTRHIVDNGFAFLPQGKQNTSGLVLTGNVYLAAEWAAATGVGRPIIYTDEAGQRHRAIGLPSEVGRIDPDRLPVRVADPMAARKFLKPLMLYKADQDVEVEPAPVAEVVDPQRQVQEFERMDVPAPNRHGVYVLDTTFKSAMAYASLQGQRNAVLVVEPGAMIAMSCATEDLRRVRAALTAGQKAIRKAELGPAAKANQDPAHVPISVSKTKAEISALPRGVTRVIAGLGRMSGADDWTGGQGHSAGRGAPKTAVISMKFTTEAQAERALKVLQTHSGLEIYAAEGALRESARLCLRAAAYERRQQMNERQMLVAQELRGDAGQATPPSNSSQSTSDGEENLVLEQNVPSSSNCSV